MLRTAYADSGIVSTRKQGRQWKAWTAGRSRIAGRVAKNFIGRRQREQIRIGGSGVTGTDIITPVRYWQRGWRSGRGNYWERYRKSADSADPVRWMCSTRNQTGRQLRRPYFSTYVRHRT